MSQVSRMFTGSLWTTLESNKLSDAAKKARTEISADLYDYCNPRNTMLLPFLGPPGHKSDRFAYNENNEFLFHGRESFKHLVEQVLSLRPDSGRQFLHVYGSLGVGKSHLMAALACFLTRTGKRVAFLPDCVALLHRPLLSMCHALTLAFQDKPLAIDSIWEAKTIDELATLAMDISFEFPVYYLIDQANALDTMAEGVDRVPQDTKDTVKQLLNKLAVCNVKIESSTANYKHGLNYKSRDVNEIKLNIFTGFQNVFTPSPPSASMRPNSHIGRNPAVVGRGRW